MSNFEFGPFILDSGDRRLTREGVEIPLTPKAFDVLLMLIANRDRTVPKEEFMEKVWAGTFVEEANLTDNISTLRQILGDDPREPQYIRTVPKRGYRFVADAKPVVEVVRGRSRQIAAIGSIALLVVVVATFLWMRRPRIASVPSAWRARSLAVLPFQPLVPADRDPALQLGMTDALISRLSSLRELTVRPTSSVMKYSSGTSDFRAVANELSVDALLDGKLQKVGDRVRLSVQLIRASDGATIWASRFDERIADIFTLQDVISERAANALAVRLTGEEKRGLSKRYTDNVAAYQLYVAGHYHWSTFRPEELMTSINYYNEALKIDPRYALAYAGIANTYTVIAVYGPLPPAEAMPKAREAAEKALQLDPGLADAHVAIAAVKLLHDWDWERARQELERTMAMDPNQTDAPTLYAYYLQANGRHGDAIAYLKRARDLAPGWGVARNDYVLGLLFARRYAEAIDAGRREIELDPNRVTMHYIVAEALAQTGRLEESRKMLEGALGRAVAGGTQRAYFIKADIAWLDAKAGKRDGPLATIRDLEKTSVSRKTFLIAAVYAGLGDRDHAFAWLRRGLEERTPFLYYVRLMPHFDPLRSDPRYADFVRSMNLQP